MMDADSRTSRAPASASRSELLDEATIIALSDVLRLGSAALRVDRCVVGLASPRDGLIHSVIGVPPSEMQRCSGYCSYAMAQPRLMVTADLRGAHGAPIVPTEAGYHMLAGGPLIDAHDAKRGGLAVLSAVPRALSSDDMSALGSLARQIVLLLEQRRRIQELSARGLHQAGVIAMMRGVLKASTTVAVIGTDLSGRIKLFSEGAERMFGVTSREAIGRPPFFLLAGAEESEPRARDQTPRPPSLSALIEGATHDAPVERTWLLQRAGGVHFPAAIVAALVTNDAGEVTGYALIARDITEQLAMERMKDDFVSMVSHELRTPLTSIRGALGLLAGEVAGPLAPAVAELVDIAHANAERLLYIVNDILDVQRLASGKLELCIEEIVITRAVERAVQLVGPVSRARGVTVAVRRSPAGFTVLADFERIVQVVVNLLSNAVKHSPPGAMVFVDIEAADDRIRVSVEDQGPGVAEHLRDRLFQKFARLSNDPGGTGLGLAIVKALVILHQGSVLFRPASPHGSIFSFEIPCLVEPSPPSEDGPPSVPTLTNPISVRSIQVQRASTRPPPRG